MSHLWKGILAVVLALIILIGVLFLIPEATDEPPKAPAPINYGSELWYVDPSSEANEALPQSPGVAPIANQPRFAWFGTFTKPIKLRQYMDAAAHANKVGLVVIYNVESRECKDLAAAKSFYRQTASAINARPALVAFEPDSLGTMELGRQVACWDTIKYGLRLFGGLPNTKVFMEAGASDWEGPPRMQRKLRRVAACQNADGILVNATHADWIHDNIAYGKRTLNLAGCPNKIVMVNTAESGRGPNPKTQPKHWCDYRQRYGLGRAPEYPYHHKNVAIAWVNRPGYTQKCYDAPVRFAPYRANNLINRATQKEAP